MAPIHSDFDGVTESIDLIPSYYIGGLLEQLTKTNATDFYDDNYAEWKETIMQHDMSIVKRLLTTLYNGAVCIPTNTELTHMTNLRKALPQLDVIRSIKANGINPTLIAEMQCLTGSMRAIFDNTLTEIYGSMARLRDKDCTKYIRYIDWLTFDLEGEVDDFKPRYKLS